MFSKENRTDVIIFSVDKFGQWLLDTLKERELSQSDLSRMAGISRGTLSNIINGARGRGVDSLKAISKALKLPPEQVFRAAGVLPPSISTDELTEQIVHDAHDLNSQDKEEVLAFIRMKQNLRKRKNG